MIALYLPLPLYLRRVLRWWWLPALTMVLGAILGWYAFHSQVPRYRAAAQFTIGYTGTSIGAEFDAHVLAIHRSTALAELAVTPPVIREAMDRAHATGALAQVAAYSSSASPVVTIAVVDSDPVRAARIANAFQAVLPGQLVRLMGPLDTGIALHTTAVALPPPLPFSPVFKRYLALGLVAGLAVGGALVALIETTRRRVWDGDEAAAVAGLRLLGVVPYERRAARAPLDRPPGQARLQAYRNLRSAILVPGAQVVAVTSTLPREGRTSVAVHLANVVAATGTRVLLVEADGRRPVVAAAFGLADGPGVSDVLAGRADVRAVIRELGHARPHIISAGHADADLVDRFGSGGFADLIAEVRGDFDLVVIDAPNVEMVAAASDVCGAADVTIVLARIGEVSRDALRLAVGVLRRNHIEIAGLIANASRGGSAADSGLVDRRLGLRTGGRR